MLWLWDATLRTSRPIFERPTNIPIAPAPVVKVIGLLGVHGVEQLETELAVGCYELQGGFFFSRLESAENATCRDMLHELLRTLRSAFMRRRCAK